MKWIIPMPTPKVEPKTAPRGPTSLMSTDTETASVDQRPLWAQTRKPPPWTNVPYEHRHGNCHRGPMMSLMNTDMKIPTKASACRIQQHRTTHCGQTGFTAGMQGWFSIQKSINVIQYLNKMKKKTDMVLSVSVKKSDRNQHLFMIFKKLSGK